MEEPTKQLYTITEVQALTQLPASTLRYWESQFAQLNPQKDGHKNRYYTKENIAFIQRVKYIRDEMKITRIDAIKKELQTNRKNSDSHQKAAEILLRIRQQLQEIRKNI